MKLINDKQIKSPTAITKTFSCRCYKHENNNVILLFSLSDTCVTPLIIHCNTNYARNDCSLKRHLLNSICDTQLEKQASEKCTRVSEGKRLQREILNEIQLQRTRVRHWHLIPHNSGCTLALNQSVEQVWAAFSKKLFSPNFGCIQTAGEMDLIQIPSRPIIRADWPH